MRRFFSQPRQILIGIILLHFITALWGIKKVLPFAPEIDEPVFVGPAVQIASSGDLNPHWFGHPGSTVIYILAGVYHIWHVLFYNTTLLMPDATLQTRFYNNTGEYYLLGRFIIVSFALLNIPLIYQVGRRAYNQQIGLIAACLSILFPIVLLHTQVIRTDIVATFFGLLSLWLCLKLFEQPTIKNQIAIGISIGLAIATRYFMVALIPLVLLTEVWLLRQNRIKWTDMLIGWLTIPVTFFLATPYFFLDFAAVLRDLKLEAPTTHLGTDGLSPLENLWWYLVEAIPLSMTWPVAILAGLGALLILQRGHFQQILLLVLVVIFLLGISLSPLHWYRWLIQILPLLALFAVDAFLTVTQKMTASLTKERIRARVTTLLLILFLIWPFYGLTKYTLSMTDPDTRLQAREWIIQNLPPGSQIAQDGYAAPLIGTNFVLYDTFSLADTGYALDEAYYVGYRYFVASSYIYDRYFAEPDRYQTQIGFYETLFRRGRLLQKFEPSATRAGPTLQIYELQK